MLINKKKLRIKTNVDCAKYCKKNKLDGWQINYYNKFN